MHLLVQGIAHWLAKQADTEVARGARSTASGLSYAVARVAARAARLLEAHPDWRAPELKRAILARARPSPDRQHLVVRYGWIPNPEYDR